MANATWVINESVLSNVSKRINWNFFYRLGAKGQKLETYEMEVEIFSIGVRVGKGFRGINGTLFGKLEIRKSGVQSQNGDY